MNRRAGGGTEAGIFPSRCPRARAGRYPGRYTGRVRVVGAMIGWDYETIVGSMLCYNHCTRVSAQFFKPIGLSIVFYAYYLGLKDWQLHSFPTSLHFMLRSSPWYYPGGLASPERRPKNSLRY
jgi:hypothetical protein